jgi:hypothetical protein
MNITLGTCIARPGEIAYGEYELIKHPISGQDHLPIIIAQGTRDGPTLWITAASTFELPCRSSTSLSRRNSRAICAGHW